VKTQKAHTPKEIAEKAQEYELILTVEASLADAINHHLTEQKATTPRKLVNANKDFRRKTFLKIVEKTNLTWKQTSYLLQNVLNCWKHTGQPQNILEYNDFNTEDTKKVIEILKKEENPYQKLEEFEIQEKNVAVVKEYQFTNIDKKILPENYKSIKTFENREESLGEFKVFASASEIVQSTVENIKKLKPEEAGIVVKPGTKYEPLIKSILEAENIPFHRKQQTKEDEDIRTFLSLLETGLTKDKVRVKDVRPIIQQLKISIPRRHENRKLEEIEEGREFKELLNAVKYLDFEDATQKYQELTQKQTKIQEIINELNLKSKQVKKQKVKEIRYYLDSFEINPKERNKGVLLADPTKISQVDRKHIFHIGIDTEWMREVKDKKWVDKEKEESKNLKDFKSLIQSGNSHFLVQNKELNEKITPCFYLNQITSKEFSSFTDLPHTKVRPEKQNTKQGFPKEQGNREAEPSEIKLLSQSSLNSFVQSPRLFYFDKLVSDADQQRLEKGNLFHMYAEYHASNPEKAQEIPLNEIVNLMMNQIDEFAEDLDKEDLKTEFKIGVQNIRNFLQDQEITAKGLEETYIQTSDENVFTEHFPGNNSNLETEPYFKDEKLGAKGKIDLILNQNHLVDYKSGRKKSVQKVLKKSHVNLYEQERFPDFQPLLYITHHRKHVDGKIKFTYIHFLNDLGDKINGQEPQTKTTITYHPETFQNKKASMEAFEYLIKDVAKSNDRRKTLEKLGYQQYQKFMQQKNIPRPFNKEKLLKTQFAEEFAEYAKKEVGDYKYVEKGVKKTLKKLVDYRMENYFKEDADQMENFLQEKLEEINEYLDTKFPVKADPDELPKRDLIIQ
jgi:hypothetical protein